MDFYIILAILYGFSIGASRAINSRLSISIGPFKASFWNHIIGFLFLAFVLVLSNGWKFNQIQNIPTYTFISGFFGAFLVAVNSYVFSKLGAIKSTLLVISGQMISSVLLNYKSVSKLSLLSQLIGIGIILVGIYLAKSSEAKRYQLEIKNTKSQYTNPVILPKGG